MLPDGTLYGIITKVLVGSDIQVVVIKIETYKAIDLTTLVLNLFRIIPICRTKANIEMMIEMKALLTLMSVKVKEATSARNCTPTSKKLILTILLKVKFPTLRILLNFKRIKGWIIR